VTDICDKSSQQQAELSKHLRYSVLQSKASRYG